MRLASNTPDSKGRKPGHIRLAQMATEQFGIPVTRNQIRHAIDRFVTGNEEPVKTEATTKPPEVSLLLSRIASLEAALEREKNRSEIILNAVRDTLGALPPLPPLHIPKSGGDDPHIAMLDISDVHLGELVDPVLTGGLSQYNKTLFRERGERLRRGVHKITGIHRKAYPVDTLYINFLGDIVTGEVVYPGQAFQVDMSLMMQIFEGAHYFANMLRDFARAYQSVHIRCVAGNHGREKGRHPRTNWDVMFYKILQILMADHPNVDIEISETSWLAYRIPEHGTFTHVLTHGDVRGWGGIPFYGFERKGAATQSMLGVQISYLHAGHIHNVADWASNKLEFLINGSWVGGSDLSVNSLARNSRPIQNFYFCHPRRGVAARYPLQLEDWVELAPDERGIYRSGVSNV